VKEVDPIAKLCFATDIRGSVRLILGSKDESRGIEGKGQVLTGYYFRSLVDEDPNFPVLWRCYRLPLPKSRHVYVSALYTDGRQNIELSLIR